MTLDPALGAEAALRARRARAEVKRAVHARERSALHVAEHAWEHPDSVEAGLRVTELVDAIPGIGRHRMERVLERLEISPRKRVGGLGSRQRTRLREWLDVDPAPARLIVLAGPTAVGKGTVAQHVRDHYPWIRHSVSWTTRAPRPGEIDGVHYTFVSDAEFDEGLSEDAFLEWAKVHNSHRYGTPRAQVQSVLDTGDSVLLEIDLQGARQIRDRMPEALLVFLAPPSWEELVRRLVGRGTEDEEERSRRLATAEVELASQDEFDAVVINRDVAEAAAEVVALIGR
ncbi:guanylate kinase [Agrococcus jejuensis]|uniref:Guanylate kinase n=1 Tax=Agrococcus jejuensis TaxID=399736 RepID=A0A1G7ZQ01_9MICO|nr:guanylate kinase [Agrococcus jejuensis]SDH10783.1 guanylate kinase [Agrococcus jejuensis]